MNISQYCLLEQNSQNCIRKQIQGSVIGCKRKQTNSFTPLQVALTFHTHV